MTESKKPDPRSTSKPGKLPFLLRTRAMGVHGLGAATVGWVLAGCIAFGFAVGSLLDNHFGTTYWMPIMVLVGIAAGFREMFRTLTILNRENEKRKSESRNVAADDRAKQVPDGSRRSATAPSNDAVAVTEPTEPRRRIFEVPAPPLPSYMGGSGNVDEQKSEQVPVENTEDLIARLLGEEEKESDKDEPDKTHEK